MKTRLSIVAVLTFFTLAFASCRSKTGGLLQCSAVSSEYYADILEYSSNPTRGNCEKVKNTLAKFVKSCDITGSVTKEEREEIESIDCSDM
ncbi:MAG: hypothetical protein NXI00_10625 [Cytophagales bacterium]|nr:hypothetical protein [Cytophagales bacterium]